MTLINKMISHWQKFYLQRIVIKLVIIMKNKNLKYRMILNQKNHK
jgi:hypothetical protein